MAFLRRDGLIQMSDGRLIDPSMPFSPQDLCELQALLCPIVPGARPFGRGAPGRGAQGAQGNQGSQGPQGPLGEVVGGSGAVYNSIALAIAGETPFAGLEGGLAPAAGTVVGTVVLPAASSAVNDFYKGWWIVNQDGTPTNGMVREYARVVKYVAGTKTFTIDKPLNFLGEDAVFLTKPITITMLKDLIEDTIWDGSVGIEFDMAGHKLDGAIDITGSNFYWIRGGSGDIVDGVVAAGGAAPVLVIEDTTVGLRQDTIYSLLFSNTTHHRVTLRNCRFYGRVAGRSPRSGWNIVGCTNWGPTDGASGVPYALVEALAGSSITVVQLDAALDSEFSGAFFYAEGAGAVVTGTIYLSVQGSIRSNLDFFGTTVASRNLAVGRAVGAGVITLTANAGGFNVDASVISLDPELFMTTPEVVNYGPLLSILALDQATGASTLTISLPSFSSFMLTISAHCWVSVVSVLGAGTTSGSGVVSGTSGIVVRGNDRSDLFSAVSVLGPLTGSVTVSSTLIASQCTVAIIYLLTSQVVGAPTVTVSGICACDHITSLRFFQLLNSVGISVSVGTYLISGSFIAAQVYFSSIALNTTVSGGTWTVSSSLSIAFSNDGGSISYSHAGTGGVLTLSGAQLYVGGRINQLRLAQSTGAGATTVNSGAITIETMAISQTNGILARATTATSTARCTGAVLFLGCILESAMTMLTSTAVGSVAEGPSSLRFENCDLRSTWIDRGAADLGTFTWATATLQWKNTHIEGLVTFLATSFTTVEAYETFFNGNAAEKSITATGTRPTTYRFWGCGFAARFDDLLPEKIDVWDVLPAAAALVQGQPVTINATQQSAVCVAGSVVEGASLDAPAGAGSRTIIVRSGRVFLAVDAGVASGDNLALDVVTPTQFFTAAASVAGQNIGRALQAAGATVAGKAYSSVSLR